MMDRVAKDVSQSLPMQTLTGLLIDDSGWVKGDKSVGVGHKYFGNVGKTATSQVAVSVCLCNGKHVSLVETRLNLPDMWTSTFLIHLLLGRSHNSALFASMAVPEKTENYEIFFRQYRADNDYIGYLIGMTEPALEGGIEFGYIIQVPGTDSTTVSAYLKGDLGELVVPEMAFQHQWANHQIKVRGDSISWFQEGKLMADSVITAKFKTGYFGIRQRYERGTRYADVKITVWKKNRVNK